MANFRPIDRATPYLLPPSVEDWLPRNHLARFVVDIVDGTGSVAYHPALMLGLLTDGYATGVYAGRRIQAATHDSIPFCYIAAGAVRPAERLEKGSVVRHRSTMAPSKSPRLACTPSNSMHPVCRRKPWRPGAVCASFSPRSVTPDAMHRIAAPGALSTRSSAAVLAIGRAHD